MRRLPALGFLVGFLCFFGYWYYSLLKGLVEDNGINTLQNIIEKPQIWLFLLAPLLGTMEVVTAIKKIVIGESYRLDRSMNEFRKNGKCLFQISDVDYVQIREYEDSEGDKDYRLSIVLKDQNKYFIDRSTDDDHIKELAEEIADFVSVKIQLKAAEVPKNN